MLSLHGFKTGREMSVQSKTYGEVSVSGPARRAVTSEARVRIPSSPHPNVPRNGRASFLGPLRRLWGIFEALAELAYATGLNPVLSRFESGTPHQN